MANSNQNFRNLLRYKIKEKSKMEIRNDEAFNQLIESLKAACPVIENQIQQGFISGSITTTPLLKLIDSYKNFVRNNQ